MHRQVEILGVRHHSPACARLVQARIAALRPKFVLIEGPSDYNARIGELLLAHELPIALYKTAGGIDEGQKRFIFCQQVITFELNQLGGKVIKGICKFHIV